jgi:transposase InsO family protein
MNDDPEIPSNRRWAEFRFSVVGGLLASPPKNGNLQEELKILSQKLWKHPTTKQMTTFGFSTIENWYYQSRNERDNPVEILKTKIRSDKNRFKSVSEQVKEALRVQYLEHPAWSYQLHADNITTVFGNAAPSYGSVRRYMKKIGLTKKKRMKKKFFKTGENGVFETREKRSFENEYCNGLWHADYHHSSLQVITTDGSRKTPIILAIIDDHSRLICHAQWYLNEDTENLVHSFSQAALKRGLPRSFLTDNGGPFTSGEFTQGLKRLAIKVENTLPYSPWQNGKQERFFGTLECRLMDMLENKKDLTLKELNDYTVAWLEMEYHRSVHTDINLAPIERFANGKDVGRTSPSFSELKFYFCREERRLQRLTDGTISLNAKRYEIPLRFRTLKEIWLRFAEWDMSHVFLVDRITGNLLEKIYPIDKVKNAYAGRRVISDNPSIEKPVPAGDGVAPLLKKYKDDHRIKNTPSSYLSKDENL